MGELRGVDANMLVVLDAILNADTLTSAGHDLGMLQPAVSAVLSRLRKTVGDPIVARVGRRYELTDRGHELRPIVRTALEEARRAFELRPAFDPGKSDRRFHIMASDYTLATITGTLLAVLGEEAPGTSVDFSSVNSTVPMDPVDLLRKDIAIVGADSGIPGKRRSLFSDSYVCLVRRDHPRLIDGALTVDDLAELPYIQVTFAPQVHTAAHDSLIAVGVQPRIALVVQGFLQVPYLLAESDMYSLVPSRLAELHADHLGLAIARTPLSRSTLIEIAYWHPSRTNDPALSWLIGVLRKAAERVEFDGSPYSPAPDFTY